MRKQDILPSYPKIIHLPWEKTARGITAPQQEAEIIFQPNTRVEVTEKIDGANCAIVQYQGHPLIRNRTAFLSKGMEKKNPAQQQFATIYQWYYQHEKLFDKLQQIAGNVAVYGEWMIAQHGMFYQQLPSWFIAYELYLYEEQHYLDTFIARKYLEECGFKIAPQIYSTLKNGPLLNYPQLEEFTQQESSFAAGQKREGIVLKISDGKWLKNRFKMVRTDFQQGQLWDDQKLKKNQLIK